MSNRTIEAFLKLSSKLGSMAAFRTLGGNLAKVDKQAKRFNRSQMLVAKGSKNMHAALMRYAAPAVLTMGANATVKSFASIERRMTRIGITAEASAAETTAALGRVREIADSIQAPVANVVDGLDSLTASGRTMSEALDLLPSVSASAHAADAEFNQMATTADAVGLAFDITADKMQNAFDILVHGGKLGKFELKDMARYLPSLAPAFAALGYEGEKGLMRLTAALQTVRLETGTSEEAGTALMDVFMKMGSNTIANNFKKNFSMDIRAEMEKTKKTGEDTLEAFIRLSREAIDGDMSKLPLLFTDKQMLVGMRALMNNTEEFKVFLEGLGSAAGATKKDLERLFDTQGKLDKFSNSWKRLKENSGSALAEMGVVDGMNYVAGSVDYATAVNKGLNSKGIDTFWQRSKWGIMNDRAAKDSMAWVGGYRTDADRKRLAAYGDYGAARTGAMQSAASGGVPIPTPRPIPTPTARPRITVPPPAFSLSDARQIKAPMQPFAAGASPRDAERTSMKALRSDPNGVAEAIDTALSSGGDKAASKIADGGQNAGERMGETANAKILAGAAAAGEAFGNAAAAKIKNAAAAANADVGRTGTGPGNL